MIVLQYSEKVGVGFSSDHLPLILNAYPVPCSSEAEKPNQNGSSTPPAPGRSGPTYFKMNSHSQNEMNSTCSPVPEGRGRLPGIACQAAVQYQRTRNQRGEAPGRAMPPDSRFFESCSVAPSYHFEIASTVALMIGYTTGDEVSKGWVPICSVSISMSVISF